jgi:hypothetical protein
MSSSISSSDGVMLRSVPAPEAAWRRFVLIALGVTVGTVALLLAAAIALDPYDTGRFGLWESKGVRQQGPRTATASRGRDPQFESAVIGNSHVQLLAPERLAAATGQRFVSLTIPGTRPPEQLAVLEYFARQRRPRLSSVVLGVDVNWCTGDATLPLEHAFPFWLYSASPVDYVVGLKRLETIEEVGNRIRFLTQANPRRARADGFWDYEPDYIAQGFGTNPLFRERLERLEEAMPPNPQLQFPAAERLRASLATLPASLRVVILHPPFYITGLVQPGSAAYRTEAACKAAFAAIAATRPNTAIIDWRRDGPEVRDASLWFDKTHYRRPLAEKVEASIAAALR